ncbi:hypothetical protein [Flavitalea sp.]|nr:hypothetical protein [Flavitalea sp.]
MIQKNREVPLTGLIIVFLVLLIAIAIRNGFVGNSAWYWVPALAIPILILVIRKTRQARQPHQRKFRRKIIQKTRRQAQRIGIDHY